MENSNLHGHSTMVGPSVAPTIEIVRGNEQGKTARLKLSTRIGRERDNDIVLTDPLVSRYHALIELVEGKWTIRDLGSANGTLVNGEPVTDLRSLVPDDGITIGDTELVFQPSSVGAQAGRPTSAPMRPPRRKSPEWNWGWIAGGLVLLFVLIGGAIFALSRLDQGNGQPSDGTAVKEAISDFVLVHEDDFSNPSSGWDDAFDRYTTKQYGNNKYYIEITTSNLVAWGLANRDIADFRLEVDAAQEQGPNNNGYGILFRFQDRENFYRFDISGEGFFLLSKFQNGEWVTLVPWTASSAINVGLASNRLIVEAIGSQIQVYANDTLLAKVEDNSFTHGNFGFFASTFSESGLIISYDDIKLWAPKDEELAVIPTVTPTRFAPAPEVALQSEAPSEEVVEKAMPLTETSTAEPEVIPTPTVTPTPEPLPEYTSRDQPLPRNAVVLKGRIIFPVFDVAQGTYSIFSAKADGSDRQLVAAEASQPTLNADGTRIAFRSWKADNRGLIERGIKGGDIWRFNTFFEAARPTFSPDGQAFLFHSREGGDVPAIYRTVGSDHQVLRRDGAPIQGEAPAWTPDGRFVYKGCLGGGCGLILSNLDGSFPLQLTSDPGDRNPVVSPDGQTVAFMANRNGNWDVYLVDIDGSGLTQLTSDTANDGLPAWSPDGKTIAFVSERDGSWSIWAMDAGGGDKRPLFDLAGSIDGRVQVDMANARGWLEESLVWGP